MNRAESDAFSRCHPAVGFFFFVGAIGLGALILPPAYILAGAVGAVSYYLLLKGGKGPWADRQPENGSNERILIEDCRYRYSHGCLTLGSEAIHCKNVILRRIRVDDGFNLLWLKFRPDTPQLFEYITVEDARGRVDTFLNVHRWTQFFNLKDRTDAPPSAAQHITMRRCIISCQNACQSPENLTGYDLRDFRLEENHLEEAGTACSPAGLPSFISTD